MKSDMPVRVPWPDLPASIHEKTEHILGGPIVEAISQAGGFSPGSADRVRTALGRCAFVKAVSRTWSASTWDLHRRELDVLRLLPESVRAPRLLGFHDDGEWVALILEDVKGTHPGTGTAPRETLSVLTSLLSLPDLGGTAAQDVLPQASEELAPAFGAWSRIRRDGASDVLPRWAQEHLEELEETAAHAAQAVAGTHLVHMDCRGDNALIDRCGQAWLIDWPWASLGARWFDGLVFLLDLRMHGCELDTDAVLAEHPLFAEASTTDLDGALAGLTGYCLDAARHPAPPHMSTIRAFQHRTGITGLEWLHTRREKNPGIEGSEAPRSATSKNAETRRPVSGGTPDPPAHPGVLHSGCFYASDMTDEVLVRSARTQDATAMAQIHVRSWRETYRGLMADHVLDDPGLMSAREKFWLDVLTSERWAANAVAVAERAGAIIGIAMSGPVHGQPWSKQLFVLYLLAEHHGSGAGAALLQSVIDGNEAAALWVADPNPRAQAFYRKHGFVPDGANKVENDIREIRMVRGSTEVEAVPSLHHPSVRNREGQPR